MAVSLTIGIIGDFDGRNPTHIATNEALSHAAGHLVVAVDPIWLPTESLEGGSVDTILRAFDGLWCAPGSPYRSARGAVKAIRWAREEDWPFIGT